MPIALQADNRTLNRGIYNGFTERETYTTDIHLNGKFDLFDTHHNILVGLDYYQFNQSAGRTFLAKAPFVTSIDIFNPVYGTVTIPNNLPKNNFVAFNLKWFGAYFQDQIDLTDQFHFLFSIRHDWADSESGFSKVSTPQILSSVSAQKFSPRVGLVYQPMHWLSLYASWTNALGASNGRTAGGRPLPPEMAKQVEGGLKLELFESRLNATVAVYQLTKENIATADISTPDPSDQVAIGEARSQGVEVDVSGQVTDQWSVIGNYAYTDTEVLKDNSGLQGNRLPDVPKHGGSLWTTYQFTKGFELGTGVFIASQRQANVANDWQLPGYVRWDAMAAYHWKVGGSRLTAQVNVNNILDKRYFTYVDQFGAPRFDAMPGMPLTVLGSLRLEYW